ncbi:hypothetical protein Syun_024948 [Stephania yunnanensis]|uniref:Ribosomal RNA-processing protein 17 n=1 Tax=Stephania yunnanensis TaxID=152371 RepID=A0AAP0HQT0_9MAGN
MEGEEEETQIPKASSRHIKKRALRNKSLTISFNEKDLRDYVTGFHKRKKKRRKEAQQQLAEKERLRRIERRKKVKAEREYVMYGGAPQVNNNPEHHENGGETEDEETEEAEPISGPIDDLFFMTMGICNLRVFDDGFSIYEGTRMYDNEDMTITVTTSEITNEATDVLKETAVSSPRQSNETKNKHSLAATPKQCNRVAKNTSLPRMRKKRDKGKGKKSRNVR